MHIKLAITRTPGENYFTGLTTHGTFTPDFDGLLTQFRTYMNTLTGLGIEVIELPSLPEYPDAYFVEDTALIFPEIAIITRPGDPSRRGECPYIKSTVAKFRKLEAITPPATIDGGDVLTAGKIVFVGLSRRTNKDGIRQLQEILTPYGYEVKPVTVSAGLHLKSEVNLIGPDLLLVSERFAQKPEFASFKKIIVPKDETYAANSLWINNHLIIPANYPKTKKALERLKLPIIEIDTSQARYMDGGLTCMSLRIS